MKLPIKFGIPLLLVLWLASGYTDYGQGKTLLMVLAMVVALWTAFSLPHPRRNKEEELQENGEFLEDEEEPGEFWQFKEPELEHSKADDEDPKSREIEKSKRR